MPFIDDGDIYLILSRMYIFCKHLLSYYSIVKYERTDLFVQLTSRMFVCYEPAMNQIVKHTKYYNSFVISTFWTTSAQIAF